MGRRTLACAAAWAGGKIAGGWTGIKKARGWLGGKVKKGALRIVAAWRGIWSGIKWTIDELLPIAQAYRVTRTLGRSASEEACDENARGYLGFGMQDILEFHEVELRRRDRVQGRIHANTQALAVALPVVTGSATLALTKTPPFGDATMCVVVGGLLAAIVSLSCSALCAVKAAQVERINDLFLQSGVSKLSQDDESKLAVLKGILMNQRELLTLTNFASASYKHLRMGLVAVAVVGMGVIMHLATS